jgi:ferredoxin
METHVRWFSATGNSLAAARFLAEALGAASLRPLLLPEERASGPARRYLFAFPLFYLGWPEAVGRAIRDFPLQAGDDVCALVTRGVKGMGAVLGRLARELASRGLDLRYGAYLDMPLNDVTLFSVRDDSRNRASLERAGRRLPSIAAGIASGRRHRDIEPFAFMGPVRRRVYLGRIESSHLNFLADASCTGCGICARLCPLGRIRMTDGQPAWSAGCQECEACINLCPRGAIQYRGSRSEEKRRYRHPDISWRDIAEQRALAIDEAAAGPREPTT